MERKKEQKERPCATEKDLTAGSSLIKIGSEPLSWPGRLARLVRNDEFLCLPPADGSRLFYFMNRP